MAVGVDLHLGAAIAEDALRHDRDRVHARDLGGDDERGGLVVRIGGAGADRGHEQARFVQQRTIPVGPGAERHQRAALRHRALQDHVRVDADQRAVVVGIAVAGAGLARADDAHHRAGVAAHFGSGMVAHRGRRCLPSGRRVKRGPGTAAIINR